jgi:two-component system, sensor histidine kinase YesM
MNEAGSEDVKEEIVKSMETSVHFYLSTFEAEIGKTLHQQNQLPVDEDI